MNQPGNPDSYRDEQEADAIADRVMRIKDPLLQKKFFSPPVVQRKCACCEEEEKEKQIQRKEANDQTIAASSETENYLSALSGGRGLSSGEKNFFEPGLGYDFSSVRLHTDSAANQSAKNLNALAYTYGNDVVFASGKDQPGTDEGKKLLAHELTHVVQQNSKSILPLQRSIDNTGHDLTSTALSGDENLERVFDNEAIVRIPAHGDHVLKIQNGLIALGINLPQFGADSRYGTETATAVRDFQRQAGMSLREQDGIVGRKTIGLLDRSLRNGTISTDSDLAAADFTFTPESVANCTGPTTQNCSSWYSDIDALVTQGVTLIDRVLTEQLPPATTQDADYVSVFSTLFRNNDTRPLNASVTDVRANYTLTKNYMQRLRTDRSLIVCGTQCEGGCASGSPAHEIAAGRPPQNIIVFCPSFRTHAERVQIVVHESHHASVPGSKDWAYPNERLINILDFQKALVNAASYHLYAQSVRDPTATSFGHTVRDTNNITSVSERNKVDRCLSFIEHWFGLIPFDLSVTIAGVRDAKNTGVYRNSTAEEVMRSVMHPWFGLTPAPRRPTQTDLNRVTAIKQRCDAMDRILGQSYTINQVTGASRWTTSPQNIIELNNATIALPERELCMALLQELVHATPNISADIESLYVGMINEMRNGRHLDPA